MFGMQAPDSYGIFKFRLLYRRPGLSVLHREDQVGLGSPDTAKVYFVHGPQHFFQVNLRPFAHNEYERFIFSAYPYYFRYGCASSTTHLISLFCGQCNVHDGGSFRFHNSIPFLEQEGEVRLEFVIGYRRPSDIFALFLPMDTFIPLSTSNCCLFFRFQ